MNSRMTRWVGVLVVATFFAFVSGCGSGRPATVPVSGAVVLDGKPLAGAAVSFQPDAGGRPATAITDEAGNFALSTFGAGDGAIPGMYKITVSKMDVQSAGQADPNAKAPQGTQLSGPPGMQGPPGPPKMLVPPKYVNPNTSGLTAEVKKGMEPVALILSSAG